MKFISIKNAIALLNNKLGYVVDRSEILHYWRNRELDFYVYVDCAVIPLAIEEEHFYDNNELDNYLDTPLPAYNFKGYICLTDNYDYLIEKIVFVNEITYNDQILNFAYLGNINQFNMPAIENKFIYCFDPLEYDPIKGDNDKDLYTIRPMLDEGGTVNFNYQSLMFSMEQVNEIIKNHSLIKGEDKPLSTKEKISYQKIINVLLHKNKLNEKAKHTLHVELKAFAELNSLSFVSKDTFANIIDELKENEDKLF